MSLAVRRRLRITALTTHARRRSRCAPALSAVRPVDFPCCVQCSAYQDSEPLRGGHRRLSGEERGRSVRAVFQVHGVSGLSASCVEHGLLSLVPDLQSRLCAMRRQHLSEELHALPRDARLSQIHVSLRELRGRLHALLLQYDLQEGISALLGSLVPSAQSRLSQLHRRRPRRCPGERNEALSKRRYRESRHRLPQQRTFLFAPSPSRSSVPSANSSVPITPVAIPRSPAPSLSSVPRDPSVSALSFTSSSPVPAADACPTSLSAPRCPCVPPSPLCSVRASSACPPSPIVPSSRPVRPTLPIAAPRASASSTPPRALRASAAPPTSRISAPTGPA